jgi:transposase
VVVLPYLLLCREDSPQRKYELRTVFDAVRYVARTGGQWRFLPHDLPPWYVVYQQMQRWLRAGCFELLVEDVRSLLREWGGRKSRPTAVVIDSRTLQSTPESGARAGYDGAKRRKGSKVHIAVDTLGHLLALTVTPADQGDREQVAALAEGLQQVTGTVELAYGDQGYTGPNAAEAAGQHGLRLEVVKHPMAKRGFVLLGSSNAASPGRQGSAASPEITNGSTLPSKVFICSPSPPSCSAISQIHSNEVPNRL